MSNDDSYIVAGQGHTTFAGPDATRLFAAATLRSAIALYRKTAMRVSRAYTPTAMRTAASRLTGKPYKRSELAQAEADLTTWIEAMKAALPVIRDEGGR